MIEQCWHRVPGGTAVAALRATEAVTATGEIEQLGVAAAHRRIPPEPWVPPIPVRHLPLPRLLLYEAWHRLRLPVVERATGPVDVIHATGMAIPPPSVPLVVTIHDLAWAHRPEHFSRHGVRFFSRCLELTRRDADLVICPSQATADDAVLAGVSSDRIRVVPWGVAPAVVGPDEVERVETRLAARTSIRAVGRDRRAPEEPSHAGAGVHPTRACRSRSGAGRTRRLARLGAAVRRTRPRAGTRFRAGCDLSALYAGAELVCYPSLSRDSGFPVLEALAQGTPVVTSTGTATARCWSAAAASS